MQYIEDTLLEVAGMVQHLPRAAPTGYRGWWPHYELDYKELKSRDARPPLDHEMIDQVLGWMTRAPLTIRQRKVMWARVGKGKLVAWRKVGQKVEISHEFARNEYSGALDTLSNWLKKQDK